MFNIFGLLFALLIAESGHGRGQFVGWPSAAAAAVAIIGVTAFLYMVASQIGTRMLLLRLHALASAAEGIAEASQISARAQRERDTLARRMPLIRIVIDAGLLGTYFVLAHTFGWVDYVHHVWGVPRYLDVLPNLLPYFALLAGSWLAQVKTDNALNGPAWRPMQFVSFQARANLMTIAPIVFVNAAYWAVMTWVPLATQIQAAFAYSQFLLMFALVLPVFVFMPLAVRAALPTRRLPDGPLRRSLEDFARRRKLRIGGLYLWETGSRHFSTAFVIGLVPGLRYVFFTDALLRRFSDAEILAVFAHEMGHVRHRHLWWLLGFVIAFSVMMLAIDTQTAAFGAVGTLAGTIALLAWGYVVFGFISRRFERQADDYAAGETAPELIGGVLLKLGMSSPSAMDRRGWRHFPIRQRVAEIALQHQRPDARKAFDAQRRRGLLMFVVVTMTALAVLVKPIREDVVSGLATYSLAQLDSARRQHAPADRIESLRERTLQRNQAMRELNENYALVAQHYDGIIAALSGRDSDALQQLAREARRNEAGADSPEERKRWKEWAETAETTEVALKRAIRNNTPWLDEWYEELERRGLR